MVAALVSILSLAGVITLLLAGPRTALLIFRNGLWNRRLRSLGVSESKLAELALAAARADLIPALEKTKPPK